MASQTIKILLNLYFLIVAKDSIQEKHNTSISRWISTMKENGYKILILANWSTSARSDNAIAGLTINLVRMFLLLDIKDWEVNKYVLSLQQTKKQYVWWC